MGTRDFDESEPADDPERRCDKCGSDIRSDETAHITDTGAMYCMDCYYRVTRKCTGADQAKEAYARGTQLLANLHYSLAELTAAGTLTHETSMRLQCDLHDVWEQLYHGTLCAVRDWGSDEETWDAADNTYSDGRPVRVVLSEDTGWEWPHYRQLVGIDTAMEEFPPGSTIVINRPPGRYRGEDAPP